MRSPQGGPWSREGQRGAIDLARVKGGAVESWKEDEEDDSVGEQSWDSLPVLITRHMKV